MQYYLRLYHVSEEPDIRIFKPRPSPHSFTGINGDVIFAIADELLHNYLLPRECPRVTYYAKGDSAQIDIDRFFGTSKAKFIINAEEHWKDRIKKAKLYLYELPADSFIMLDEGAGYHISYEAVKPLSVKIVSDVISEIEKRGAEIRFLPELKSLAAEISKSSLQFSIIRLKNAV